MPDTCHACGGRQGYVVPRTFVCTSIQCRAETDTDRTDDFYEALDIIKSLLDLHDPDCAYLTEAERANRLAEARSFHTEEQDHA